MTPIYDNILPLAFKAIPPSEENALSCYKDKNTKEKHSTDLTLKLNGKKEGSGGMGI